MVLFSFLLIPVFGYMAVIWSEPLIWVAMTIQLLWAYSRVPELIWGEKSNPDSDYPKNYIRRVLEQYHEEPGREVFVNIAQETSIGILKEKCPISFAKFHEEFIELCASVQ